MAVHVLTDSTADLPERIATQHGITVVPLNLHFNDEVLKDGEDIWAEEFYHRMVNESITPDSSAPTVEDFVAAYRRIAQPGDTILSVHLSEKLSATLKSARKAAELVAPDISVRVVDSRLVSMGLGWAVLEAARSLNEGVDLETVLQRLDQASERAVIYFSVDNLEHLHRTGRIGTATAAEGVVNVKPIFSIANGELVTVELFRGSQRSLSHHPAELVQQRIGDRRYYLALVHAEQQEEIERIREAFGKDPRIEELILGYVGPIVGAHVGPGTVGVIALPLPECG